MKSHPFAQEAQVFNTRGEQVGKVELPEKVFGLKPSAHFLHEVTTIYLANQREGSAHTKTRSEVSGGGKKPWKQKHTGRARAGSIRSPLWRKGGVVFGPRHHSYRLGISRRKAQQALAHALSVRAQSGTLMVLDSLTIDGAKTKQVASLLKALKVHPRALLVVEQFDPGLQRASRNIPELECALVSHLNAYQVLNSRSMIITKAALDKLASQRN